jgi:ABC-type enterobactin transport system permease subunit
MGRMIAFDLVMQPFRAPFTRTVPDATGAGETVEARGAGMQLAIGQLISCPICAGTWAAGLLVCFLFAWPGAAHVFLFVLAAIGAAEMLNAFVELLCWKSDLARARAGQIYRANAEHQPPKE